MSNPIQKPYSESHVQSNCLSPEPDNSNETVVVNVEATSQPVANGSTADKVGILLHNSCRFQQST